jgi:hypothetical protein
MSPFLVTTLAGDNCTVGVTPVSAVAPSLRTSTDSVGVCPTVGGS